MSQKRISQYYTFSIIWTLLGIAMGMSADGFMKFLYYACSVACFFSAIEFYQASETKGFLSKITFFAIAMGSSSVVVFTLL